MCGCLRFGMFDLECVGVFDLFSICCAARVTGFDPTDAEREANLAGKGTAIIIAPRSDAFPGTVKLRGGMASELQRGDVLPPYFAELVVEAKIGSPEAAGRLLEPCRPNLLIFANDGLSPKLGTKVATSDIVQKTFLEAQWRFAVLARRLELELRVWLRRIVWHNPQGAVGGYETRVKRDAVLASRGASLARRLPGSDEIARRTSWWVEAVGKHWVRGMRWLQQQREALDR